MSIVPGTKGRAGRPELDDLQFQLLDPKALKLLDFLWRGRTQPGLLKTNTADRWMQQSGIRQRGAFFQCLHELEAHQLIRAEPMRDPQTKQKAGLALELRLPPEAVPETAFQYYEHKLREQIERLTDRLDQLYHLWQPLPDAAVVTDVQLEARLLPPPAVFTELVDARPVGEFTLPTADTTASIAD